MPRLLSFVLAVVLVPSLAWPSQPPTPDAEPIPDIARGEAFIDVVFALDTTGSMGGLIEGAKQKIWSIANAIASAEPTPEIRMGLLAYRDVGDAYVTNIAELTGDLDYFYSSLMQLQAGGGGDTPESVNQALHESITRFAWSDDRATLRLLYLVGDAPPHMDYDHDVKYPVSCERAKDLDIFINTIQCGRIGGTEAVWREIADFAGGEYFAIAQSGGMKVVETPYDGDLARLSRESDATFVSYGSSKEKAAQESKLEVAREIDEAGSATALADRAAFKSSAAGKASFGGGKELLQDIESGKVKLEEIDEKELPEVLRAVPADKRAKWVANRAAHRQGLQEEILWTQQKRLEWLKANTTESADGFDRKVLEALKAQAASKGIQYEDE